VELGVLLDLRNPDQWQRPWVEHYQRTLERVEQIEARGAGSVWLTEHHFFPDGYLPQPLVFAAAIAARTTRIRIGTAVVVAALRHPTHLAEEAAVVDILSGGRLELGLGAGWSGPEYSAFGADIDRKFSLTDGALSEVQRLLATGGVTPGPVQRPVPFWLGYQGPQGARRAGRLGVGLLSLKRSQLEPYRAGLVEGGYDPDSARMSGLSDIIVADDPLAAASRILPHLVHQAATYRNGRVPGVGTPPPEVTIEQLHAKVDAGEPLPGLTVLTADDAIREIRDRTSGLPVRHVHFWASVAGMPDDLVDRHLELLFTKVRPALA
jgi:alkanesulfonate monooxygenase SsuD/methylene tetrahydromethanopterin reductase-like flavin-dependent oxidoreductase (luciferase family)